MSIGLTPPPERDFPAVRLQQRKQQLVARIDADRRPTRRPVRRRRPLALAGALVAIAAVASVAAIGLPFGGSGGASPAAAAVLRDAARTAASQRPTAPPVAGQYVYTKSEGLFQNTAVTRGQTIKFYEQVTREAWIGPDGSGRIRERDGTPRFVTSADRDAWLSAGKPALTGDRNTDETFRRGGLHYFDLSKLPTDPHALESLVENRTIEGGPPGDAETFTILGDLLRETYAPPGVRSALYTIASELPGVQLVGPTDDHLGRRGTAVAYVSQGLRHELIFDPRTAALLGEQTTVSDPSQVRSLPAGAVVEWTSYLSSGVVDSTTATP
jgi:hypothetical protein